MGSCCADLPNVRLASWKLGLGSTLTWILSSENKTQTKYLPLCATCQKGQLSFSRARNSYIFHPEHHLHATTEATLAPTQMFNDCTMHYDDLLQYVRSWLDLSPRSETCYGIRDWKFLMRPLLPPHDTHGKWKYTQEQTHYVTHLVV